MYSGYLLPIVLLSLALSACKNDPKPAAGAESSGPDTLPVYTPPSQEGARTYIVSEGKVHWGAKKVVGEPHYGFVEVLEGELLYNEGQVIGGKVTLDMQSITVNNLKDAADRATLENHLKDTDFFDVKKYPTGTFEIEEVLPSQDPNFNAIVRGSLTIKDKSNPVNIPVKISMKNEELNASSVTFTINRMDWGLNFRSGLLGTPKDKVIQDMLTLSLELKAGPGE